jgi:hypothetical protein
MHFLLNDVNIHLNTTVSLQRLFTTLLSAFETPTVVR